MKKIFTLCTTLFFAQLTFATVYYVSHAGNDSNTGTSPAQAWKTINRVNTAIITAQVGDQFLFNRGDVFVGEIAYTKNGAPGNPIVFGAYGSGENPVISGAEILTGWTVYAGNIWVAQSSNQVSQLFVEDQFQVLARYPNTGFLRVAEFSSNNQLISNDLTQPNGYWNGAKVAVRTNEWSYEMMDISTHNGNQLSFFQPYDTYLNNGDPDETGNGFFIFDKFEELDTEGEWYFDAASGRVYLYSLADPNLLRVEGTIHDWGINERGNWHIKYITIQDLTFEKQGQNAIWFGTQGVDLSVRNCKFFRQGHDAIEIWGENIELTHNEFAHILGRAIFGRVIDRATISHNAISYIGMYPGYGISGWQGMTGIHLDDVRNAIIAYNTVSHTGYTALELNVINSVVEKNVIKNACLHLADGAGIHTWGYASYGSIFRNNLVMNVVGNHESYHTGSAAIALGDPNGILVFGIYLDNNVHDHVVENNTIINTSHGGILVNSDAYSISILNNNIYNTPSSQIAVYDNQTNHGGNFLGTQITGNTCYATTSDPSHSSTRLLSVYGHYNALANFGKNYYVNPNRDKVTFRGHWWISPAATAENLGQWQQAVPAYNVSSVYAKKEMVIYTNETNSPITYNLSQPHEDLDGNLYETTITIAAFSSRMLIAENGGGAFPPNANNEIPAYEGFLLGTNLQQYNGWEYEELGNIAVGNPAIAATPGTGTRAVRLRLAASELESNGYASLVPKLEHISNTLGAESITAILGYPAAFQQDGAVHCGSSGQQSGLFDRMYEPIWDAGENGTPINEDNPYALYVYHTVNTYKDLVDIWTPLDSVDYDGGDWGWLGHGEADNWWDDDPDPCHLLNIKAPIEHYIRMLRITYEVSKYLDSTSLVSLGGIRFPSFLNAVLRNTDNPNDGLVDSVAYPFRGGAYFDVLSFESYPHHSNLVQWWNNGWNFNRNSDAGAEAILADLNEMNDLLESYDYTGFLYPRKYFIVCRTGISRNAMGVILGGEEVQRNFVAKAALEAERAGIIQLHFHNLSEAAEPDNADEPGELMGLYENLEQDGPYEQRYTGAGVMFRQMHETTLSGVYDAVRSAQMNLPNGVKGGAYRNPNGTFYYLLWAETQQDNSEVANATYSFPNPMGISALTRMEWNAPQTGASTSEMPVNINLSGSPSFFYDAAVSTFPVEWLAFEAIPDPGRNWVELTWATASEQGNDRFTVERSVDGFAFQGLVDVPSQGNSTQVQTYETHDLAPLTGMSFYRIRQTDLDGSFSYSQVVEIVFSPGEKGFMSAHPVPARQGETIRVTFLLTSPSDASLSLKNASGQTVWSQVQAAAQGGVQVVEVPTHRLSKGYYYMVVNNHLEVFAQKVAIVH